MHTWLFQSKDRDEIKQKSKNTRQQNTQETKQKQCARKSNVKGMMGQEPQIKKKRIFLNMSRIGAESVLKNYSVS
jgi:hypothetical protein